MIWRIVRALEVFVWLQKPCRTILGPPINSPFDGSMVLASPESANQVLWIKMRPDRVLHEVLRRHEVIGPSGMSKLSTCDSSKFPSKKRTPFDNKRAEVFRMSNKGSESNTNVDLGVGSPRVGEASLPDAQKPIMCRRISLHHLGHTAHPHPFAHLSTPGSCCIFTISGLLLALYLCPPCSCKKYSSTMSNMAKSSSLISAKIDVHHHFVPPMFRRGLQSP